MNLRKYDIFNEFGEWLTAIWAANAHEALSNARAEGYEDAASVRLAAVMA